MVRHYPENQQESEEAEDMYEQDHAFGKRQMSREEDVEADGQRDE